MVTVDGESDSQRAEGGTAEERPEKQAPVMETFATKDAEADAGMDERHEIRPSE